MSVKDHVTKIIIEQLGAEPDEVTPDASFREDLGADSLDQIELTMACEEAFSIEIPDADAAAITHVRDLVAYIGRRVTSAV